MDAVPFLSAKVVRACGFFRVKLSTTRQKVCAAWFVWKISTPTGSIFRQNLVQAHPATSILLQKGRVVEGLPEKSAYSDLWTHKKNVAMDKQKVNTTSSMNRKGYSSSSHYRINPVAEKSEQVLAIKFVQWDVPPLENLRNSKVYLLRVKLNRGERMNREEKNWLCEAVNSNTFFRTAVPLQGYRFDFFDVLKKYLVNQYGQWTEYYAPDRTSLRAYLYGRINQIVEIPKY